MSQARFIGAVALGVALVSAGTIATARRSSAPAPSTAAAPESQAATAVHAANRVEREGLLLSFTLDESPRGTAAKFFVTDAASNKPVSGLHPMAWMSARRTDEPPPDDKRCREKIKEYLGGLLSAQADVDMNSYLLWTLNHDNTISVINPQIAFSRTKTRAIVSLSSRGADWAFRPDGRFAYVSLPSAGQVAVVDGVHYRVSHALEVGRRPGRVRISPDGSAVWVANDAGKSVSVISTAEGTVVRSLPAGAGAHDLVFVDGGRWVWATSADDDVVHVYEARDAKLALQVPSARGATAIAASDRAGVVYVATSSGELLAFDAKTRARTRSLRLGSELSVVRFDRSGRFAVALSRSTGRAWVIDASTSEVRKSIDGLASPVDVSFTEAFAYVRSASSERVSLIDLGSLDRLGSPGVVEIVAGQRRPEEAAATALASAIIPTPESGTVVIAQPADRALYIYNEGMMAPSGTLQSFGREPLAVAVQDRSLAETEPGVYSTVISLDGDATYDVELLLDTPRVATCFEHHVKGHGAVESNGPAFEMRPAFDPKVHLRAGEEAQLDFRIVDRKSGGATARENVDVVFFRPPFQWRGTAARRPDGTYGLRVTPRVSGQHTLAIVASSSAASELQSLAPIVLFVDGPSTGAAP
jgi:DNA-binding beta-propeller fold protein YncE